MSDFAATYSVHTRRTAWVGLALALLALSSGCYRPKGAFQKVDDYVPPVSVGEYVIMPGDVLQVRVYLTDIADWPAFNTLYAAWAGAARPARAVVPVPALHYGFRIEIEAVALA